MLLRISVTSYASVTVKEVSSKAGKLILDRLDKEISFFILYFKDINVHK